MRTALHAVILAFAYGIFAGSVWAQDATGSIVGNVTDASGGSIVGAKVTVTNEATEATKVTNTDDKGYYQVRQLPVGMYKITAEATGFSKTESETQNPLDINQALRIDLQLEVGQLTDTVSVSAQGTGVETQNSTVAGTVTGQAVYELPLNGRNAFNLIQTLPGATPTNPDNTQPGAGYSIGGGRTDSVTFLLDGGNNNNLLSNTYVVNPNPDAIAEFRVIESNYNAEYGRNAGGIVSVVTKSGGNDLHGTAYDYLRNNDLNANDFFRNENGEPRSVLKRNQFGGTIGGPVMIPKLLNGRNKVFFFFAYQGQRQNSVSENGNIPVYTPLEAQGNFSQAVNGGPDPNVAKFLLANRYYQSNKTLAQQAIIDPTKIDPVAQAYFKNNLMPISPTGILASSALAKDNVDSYLGKIDLNITSHDTISGTFSESNTTQAQPFTDLTFGANIPGYTDNQLQTAYFGAVTYNHTFTPALLNEFRVTAQRSNVDQYLPSQSLPYPNQLGINITSDDPHGPTLLNFNGSGLYVGFSPNGPTNLINNTYAFYENLSWTKGTHNMKYGFYFSPYQNNTVYDYYINGAFIFYGSGTKVGSGTDLADFLLGLPDEYIQFPKAPSNIRSNSYAGYAQDEWHVTKRLTLNLGIRYEYAQPKYDTQGRSYSFIPGLQSTRFPNAPTGLVFPGDAGAPRGSNFPDKNDWSPRFGFALDPRGDGKTSIRGGFGMFYDILKGEDNLQFNGQVPFFSFADLFPPGFNATTGKPPGSMENPYAAAGAVNPFPSTPPTSSLNFANAGFLPIGGSNVFYVDPNLRTPYVFQYNLSVQQELASGLTLETAYVGYSAHKLTGLVDVNPYVLGQNYRLFDPGDPKNSTFSYLDEFQNIGKANYNAMQVNMTKRINGNPYVGNTFFTLAYTWAHEIDNVSGYRQRNLQVPAYDHNAFRGSGDTDIRNMLSFAGGWDLPFDQLWKGGPRLLTKGWSLYPIVTWHSGFALDVFANLSNSNTNPGPAGDGQAALVRADLVGNTVTTYNAHNYQTINGVGGNYYFNPNNFSNTRLTALNKLAQTDPSQLVGQFTYGTFPRNGLRGPGFINTDLALAKHIFLFGEKLDAELRGDAFNVFNHTNFANPSTTIGSSQFGVVSNVVGATDPTNPSGPRIIQVALHLRF
jgi:outer membrane receptor protein involved in Fe transport